MRARGKAESFGSSCPHHQTAIGDVLSKRPSHKQGQLQGGFGFWRCGDRSHKHLPPSTTPAKFTSHKQGHSAPSTGRDPAPSRKARPMKSAAIVPIAPDQRCRRAPAPCAAEPFGRCSHRPHPTKRDIISHKQGHLRRVPLFVRRRNRIPQHFSSAVMPRRAPSHKRGCVLPQTGTSRPMDGDTQTHKRGHPIP